MKQRSRCWKGPPPDGNAQTSFERTIAVKRLKGKNTSTLNGENKFLKKTGKGTGGVDEKKVVNIGNAFAERYHDRKLRLHCNGRGRLMGLPKIDGGCTESHEIRAPRTFSLGILGFHYTPSSAFPFSSRPTIVPRPWFFLRIFATPCAPYDHDYIFLPCLPSLTFASFRLLRLSPTRSTVKIDWLFLRDRRYRVYASSKKLPFTRENLLSRCLKSCNI